MILNHILIILKKSLSDNRTFLKLRIMGMDSAKLSNSNNRKLQNRIRSFDERILSAETRKNP
jgi:hypothetical protein